MNGVNSIVSNSDRMSSLCSKALDLVMELRAILPSPISEGEEVKALLKQQASASGSKLTARHLEAVIALMQTETLEEAAARLHISHNTMRNHVRAIIQRTDLNIRTAAELRGWCIGVTDLMRFK